MKVDKSRKGSVDEPIKDLVELINHHGDLYTTSSCSGRVSLFGEAPPASKSNTKKGGKWVYSSHDPPQGQEFSKAIAQFLEDDENKERLDLRFEPFILASECRNLEIGKLLIQAGLESGFRESGLVIGNDRFTATIRSSSKMEIPVCQNGALLVSNEYLEYLTILIHERFKTNTAKIQKFHKAIMKLFPENASTAPVGLHPSKSASEVPSIKLIWEKLALEDTEGEKCLQRWGHSVCCVENQLIVFGGYGGQASHQRLNDVICIDPVSKKMQFPALSGTIPSPRMHHTGVAIGDSMYIIGGRTHPEDPLDEVFRLDCTTWNFQKIQVSLPRRFRHSSCGFGESQIIIFGGCGVSGALNDLWMFDTESLSIRELQPVGQWPSPRMSHGACIAGKTLFIHGGFSDYCSVYNDLFQLNLEVLVWTEIKVDGFKFPTSFSHCFFALDCLGILAFYGGCPSTQEDRILLMKPDMNNSKVLKIELQEGTNWVTVQQKTVVLNGVLYVIGGGAFCFSFGSIFSSCHSIKVSKLMEAFCSPFARKEDQENLETITESLYGLIVPKRHAKVTKDALKEQDWLDRKYKSIRIESGYRIAFPLTKKGADRLRLNPEIPYVESTVFQVVKSGLRKVLYGSNMVLQELEFSPVKIKATALSPGERLRTVLINHLRKSGLEHYQEALDEIPVKWEKFGDLILLPKNCLKSQIWHKLFSTEFWKQVAEALDCRKLARQAPISNSELRSSRSVLLFGDDGWVQHRENGILFAFDVTKCMFSSGNVSERIRMSEMKCENEIIVDLYTGIGYYSIPLLVKSNARKVFACEWNRHAIKALKMNLKSNGVESRCEVLEGDCRKVAPKKQADRVLLGLLPTSQGGWKTAIESLKPTGGWLHLHENVKDIDEKVWIKSTLDILEDLAMDCGYKWEISVQHCEHVKWYAPHIRHVVLDVLCQQIHTPDPCPCIKNEALVDGSQLTEQDFWNLIVAERKPKIIKNVDLGDVLCCWNAEYLASADESQTTIVSSHVCTDPKGKLNFTNKNFSFQSMSFTELIERCSQLKIHTQYLASNECYYLRSIGNNPRKERSWIHKSFPVLSKDLKLPSFLTEKKLFSTVLRVSSPEVQLWTHFDVMDNLLIQIIGTKRIKLWPPSDEPCLYIKGSSSEVVDVEDPDLEKYPKFAKASCVEWELNPGDVLYIPALWFHNVKSMDFAVSVNAFFHHLPQELYDKKDLYGNRDPVPIQQAQHHSQKIIELLNQLPDDYRKFYGQQIIRNLENNI